MNIPMHSTIQDGLVELVEGSRFSVELVSSYEEGKVDNVVSLAFFNTRSEARMMAASALGSPARLYLETDAVFGMTRLEHHNHPAWGGMVTVAHITAHDIEHLDDGYAYETLTLTH